jgi:hypothetical protein
MSSFIFQSVPERFDLRKAISPGKGDRWDATRYVTAMQPGDIVFFWMAGDPSIRGLYGWGQISSPAVNGGVEVTYQVKFSKAILATELQENDALAQMLILRAPQGTNFLLTEDEAKALVEKIQTSGETPPAIKSLTPSEAPPAAPPEAPPPVFTEASPGVLPDTPPPVSPEGPSPAPPKASPPMPPDAPPPVPPEGPSPLPEPPTSTPFYSDHPAQRDLLNRKAVAETIATMIESVWREDNKENLIDRSFIVHLHGRWGSGKTSILNFLSEALLGTRTGDARSTEPDNPAWVIVNYNAWRNQSLGPAWWTLMEAVYTQGRDQLGGWFSAKGQALILRDRWWRIRSSHAPLALTTFAIVAIVLWLSWVLKSDFAVGKWWLTEGLAALASCIGIIVAIFTFGQTYRIGSARTAKSYLELSRDPVSPLITRYSELVDDIGRPVAVFIDDLDRCNGEFVVELLQTIQTLFRNAKVLYVVAADRDWVCSSYQQQYAKFSDSLGEPGKSLGHLFVEKVFQLSVEVPRLGEAERDAYWDQLVNAREPASPRETEAITAQIIAELESANTEAAINDVVDRYRGDPDRADIASAQAFKRLHAEPLVKAREHFLLQYRNLIEPNPRAMKRLLNAYGFRRGFDLQSGRRSHPDALVRWTILENRWPILADYLEGRSSGLKQSDIIEALKKDTEVLRVADGLTWDMLRPVPSAPDQPPSPEITPGPDVKV